MRAGRPPSLCPANAHAREHWIHAVVCVDLRESFQSVRSLHGIAAPCEPMLLYRVCMPRCRLCLDKYRAKSGACFGGIMCSSFDVFFRRTMANANQSQWYACGTGDTGFFSVHAKPYSQHCCLVRCSNVPLHVGKTN